MTFALNFWQVLTSLLPVLLVIAGLALLALVLDSKLSNRGKW